jgi:hypothetical protein
VIAPLGVELPAEPEVAGVAAELQPVSATAVAARPARAIRSFCCMVGEFL